MTTEELLYFKASVMQRAWKIFNNCRKMFPTFKSALIQAWEVEKSNYRSKLLQLENIEFDLREKFQNHDFNLDNSERVFAYDKRKH